MGFPNRLPTRYHQRRMRALAAVVAMMVLLGGMLVPCPACERAEAQSAPADAHACCARQVASEDESGGGTRTADHPGTSGDHSKSTENPDCSSIGFLRSLAMLQSEQVRLADASVLVTEGLPMASASTAAGDFASTFASPVALEPIADPAVDALSPTGAFLSPLRL